MKTKYRFDDDLQDTIIQLMPHQVDLSRSSVLRVASSYDNIVRVVDEIDGWLFEKCGSENGITRHPVDHLGTFYGLQREPIWAMMWLTWYFKDPDLAFEFKLRWY